MTHSHEPLCPVSPGFSQCGEISTMNMYHFVKTFLSSEDCVLILNKFAL